MHLHAKDTQHIGCLWCALLWIRHTSACVLVVCGMLCVGALSADDAKRKLLHPPGMALRSWAATAMARVLATP